MTGKINEDLLQRVSGRVTSLIGLKFGPERIKDLERALNDACLEFGFKEPERFAEWIINARLTREETERLAGHLTVGETYFFRDKEVFDALEQTVLPGLVERHKAEKRLRIWSAGCSTGEEPYSIAMIIAGMMFDIKDWNVLILATDVSSKALKKAMDATYGEWSFRSTPKGIKERYFKKTDDGRYCLVDRIRKMVEFKCLNLIEDAYPSLVNNTNAMDLILCRNVLMYFSQDTGEMVIERLGNCLVGDGLIITSPAEAYHFLSKAFAPVTFPGAMFYRKALPTEKLPGSATEAPAEKPPESGIQMASVRKKRHPPHGPAPKKVKALIPAKGTGPGPVVKKTAPAEIDEAERLYRLGLYQQASELLEGSFNQTGQIWQTGQTGQTGPDDQPRAFALLSRIYANQGRLELARTWCERAIQADRVNPALHFLKATILMEEGLLSESMDSLKKTLYLDPRFVIAYYMSADISARLGDAKGAARNRKNTIDLLSGYDPEALLPGSDGMTAGRLIKLASSISA